MKIKLFISALAVVCGATRIATASITVPVASNNHNAVQVQQQPTVQYIEQPSSVLRGVKIYKNNENTPSTETAQPAAVSDNQLSLENVKCYKNAEAMLFCIDERGKPYTGKRTVKQSENKYFSIENFKSGYKDGLCTYFDEKGQRRERSYYKLGVKNGMHKIYYSDNKIKIRANYKDGELDGVSDIYDLDGSLRGSVKYKRGRLEKGFCRENGKKEEFKRETINSHPYNSIVSCGLPV